MKNRAVPLLLLLPVLLALSACGNKGPLLPPPAPDAEEWPDAAASEEAETDDVDESEATRREGEVDPDARLNKGDDADDLEDAADKDRVDGEGEDPVPGAGVPAADGDL